MRNSKLTNILLILLLIFNVAFIGKWWLTRRKMHHPKEMNAEPTAVMNDRTKGGMFLIKALALDTMQQKKLNTILEVHYNFLDRYMAAYLRNQTNFFNALKDNQDSSTAFRCADSLGILKVAMERELFLHFQSIKNICNNTQQKQYNDLIDNMSKDFVHHHNALLHIDKPKHDSL
jgi:hypothetical protein